MSVITMELRDGREKRNDRSNYIETRNLPRYRRIGSGSVDRIYPRICGCCTRKPNSPCERKRNSSVQNIEPHTRKRISLGYDRHPNACQSHQKYTITKYFYLDKYLESLYINSHNNPTKNKKARRQPGSEVNLRLTPKRFLSPLLFAVNQKI